MNENLAKELRETRRKLDENHTRAEYVELKNFDDESAIFAEEEARRLAVEKKSLQTQMKVLRYFGQMISCKLSAASMVLA